MGGKKRSKKKEQVDFVQPDREVLAVKSVENEIEQIFSNRKKKPRGLSPAPAADGGSVAPTSSKQKIEKRKQKAPSQQDNKLQHETPTKVSERVEKSSAKKTKDGLTIYTEEEIGWNKKNAGGTPLCPFDCDCCF